MCHEVYWWWVTQRTLLKSPVTFVVFSTEHRTRMNREAEDKVVVLSVLAERCAVCTWNSEEKKSVAKYWKADVSLFTFAQSITSLHIQI